MNKTVLSVLGLLVVVFGVYYLVSSNSSSPTVNPPATNDNSNTAVTPSTTESVKTTTQPTKTTTTTKPATLPSVAVSIKNFAFSPSVLKIKTGTKVVWTNNDSASHTVTFDADGSASSAILAKGESFSYTFLDPGSVTYHCSLHTNMKGSIIVEN